MIKAQTSESRNLENNRKSIKSNPDFFRKINKIDKPLAKEKIQINQYYK